MTLRRSAKPAKLVCELSRNRSRPGKSRNRKRRRGRRRQKKGRWRRRPSSQHNVLRLRPPERESGSFSFSLKALVILLRMMKARTKPLLKSTRLRRAKCSPVQSLRRLLHQRDLQAASLMSPPSPAPRQKNREIHTSRSFLILQTADDQRFLHLRFHKLSRSHPQQRRKPIFLPPIPSTELLTKRLQSH